MPVPPHRRTRVAQSEPALPPLIRAALRDNGVLVTAVVTAGLGWGVALGALGAAARHPAPLPITRASADVGAIAVKLRERNGEYTDLQREYASVEAQLLTTRRELREVRERAAPVPVAVQPPAVQGAALAVPAAQSVALAALRAQVDDLKNDNTGLEQNYMGLLDALHRTQNEVFIDRKALVAAASREKAQTLALASATQQLTHCQR